MMDFNEFTEAVLRDVEKKANGEFAVRIHTSVENNGINMTGIAAMDGDGNESPSVYLDKRYREYGRGRRDYNGIVNEVYWRLAKYLAIIPEINLDDFMKWETAKRNIYAKLINAGQNKEMLETVPHRMFLDLAVVYYALVRVTEEESGTILISNSRMESWGQEEETLYRTAMENMRAEGEAVFVSMEALIKQIWSDVVIPPESRELDADTFILTNSRKKYGATELLDGNTLRRIADEVGDGFVVIPSSLHECLILRPRKSEEYGWLADMLQEVNDTQVSEEERLSYHVYVYSRMEEMLKVVA